MANENTVLSALSTLLAVYPLQEREVDSLPILRRIWCNVLSDIPDGALELAVGEYIRTSSKWRPVPGEIRCRALELAGLDGNTKALEAWNQIADIDDETMTRFAREYHDEVAVEAIKQMRRNQHPPRDGEDVRMLMAERQRLFVVAYKELSERKRYDALPPGEPV